MLTTPMEVLNLFPVRKSRKQKQAFRDAVLAYAAGCGYTGTVEKGSLGSRNLVMGNPETAEYLITAHYDTCARLPFPNLITPCNLPLFLLYQVLLVVLIFALAAAGGGIGYLLTRNPEPAFWTAYALLWVLIVLMMVGPANRHNANDNTSGVIALLETARSLPDSLRGKVCFVLFDLEEAGLIGSASYRKRHKKASEKQIVLNLDCVGDGDEILLFPTAKLRKAPEKMVWLSQFDGTYGVKSICVHKKGFSCYPSDQANFQFGVGICALRRSRWAGLYLSRIHTGRDTILEETNINILRAAIITLISGSAVQ